MFDKFTAPISSAGAIPTLQQEKIIFTGFGLTTNPYTFQVQQSTPPLYGDIMQSVCWENISIDSAYIGVTPSDEYYFKYDSILRLYSGFSISADKTVGDVHLINVDVNGRGEFSIIDFSPSFPHGLASSITTSTVIKGMTDARLQIFGKRNCKLGLSGATILLTNVSMRELTSLYSHRAFLAISLVSALTP